MKTPLVESTIEYRDSIDPTDINIKSMINIGTLSLVTRYVSPKVGVSSNVAFPSIITSRARVTWYRLAMEVVRGGGRLLYCDTDSLFIAVPKTDVALFKSSSSVAWEDIERSVFISSKAYAITKGGIDSVRVKGTHFNQHSFESVANLFRSGAPLISKTTLFRKGGRITIEEVDKVIQFNSYSKRVFNVDKTHTSSIWI